MKEDPSDPPNDNNGQAGVVTQYPTPIRYIHSDVWDRLVENKDDLVGMVAYGLYQQRKREWIDYFSEKNGALPCQEQVKGYSAGQRSTALKALREEAEGIMFRFGEEYAASKMQELQRKAFNSRTIAEIATAREELNKIQTELSHKTGYVHHVKTHIVGWFALAALIGLITLGVSLEKSPYEFIKMIFGVPAEHKSGGPQQ